MNLCARKWTLGKADEFSIFISQAGYPIKGLHQVIKATSLLKIEFPIIQIRVAGPDITANGTFKEKVSRTGYAKYFMKLIQEKNLKNHIVFLGSLTEEQMAEEYLRSHIFVCPSSIENSPNSLGEAQLLGVPCVASYVGGIPDMIEHQETGLLYRFEEFEMLADNLKTIFKNPLLSANLSRNSIEAASYRHNRDKIVEDTANIYKLIYG